jgi:hypothetical protein
VNLEGKAATDSPTVAEIRHLIGKARDSLQRHAMMVREWRRRQEQACQELDCAVAEVI